MPYKNKEDRVENRRMYRGRNLDKILARSRQNNARDRNLVLDKLGKFCVTCGFSDVRALQIDHIESGSGERDRKKYDTRTFYRAILKGRYDTTKLQILCANCNWIKKHTNNESRGIANKSLV